MEEDVRLKELVSSLRESSHCDLPAVIDRSLSYVRGGGGDKAHSYLCTALLGRESVDGGTWRQLLHYLGPVQALLVVYTNTPRVSVMVARWMAGEIERVLSSSTLSSMLYRESCKPSPSLSPAQQQLLSALTRITDCLANKLGRSLPPSLLHSSLFSLLGAGLLNCLQAVHTDLKGGQDRSLAFSEAVLSKAAILGHAETVLLQLMPTLEVKCRDDPLWERVSRSLFCRVSSSALDAVLTALVQLIKPSLTVPHPLYLLLGDLALTNHRARLILTHKLWLTSWKEGQDLLGKSLQSAVGVWSDGACVRRMDARHHIWLCKLLVLGTMCLSPHMTPPTSSALQGGVMRGLQVHMECGVEGVRERGLAAGQCLMNTLHSVPKDKQLHFDLGDNPDVEAILQLARPMDEQQQTLEASATTDTLAGGEEEGEGGEERENESQTACGGMVSVKVASDSDSDNDLEPYDMSNDPDHTQTPPPRYLRDCLSVLVAPSERGPVETTLSSLPLLISRCPPDLSEVCVELARALLHLHDSWDTPSFTLLRHSALVALTTSRPRLLAPFLTAEFYSANHNMRQRLDILEVISSAATELSTPSPPTLPSPEAPHTPSQKPWQQVINERLSAKTRVISKGPRKPPPPAVPSRFSPVAPLFFYPLTTPYDHTLPSLDLLGRDCLLLGHLVRVLGNVVWCACHSPSQPAMARALLDFTWALRYHPGSSVRQAVLCALNLALVATPTNYLLSDMHEAIAETMLWVEDVCSRDGDDEVRALAAHSLSLLTAITTGKTLS